jgi:hypothetical protein
MKVGKAVAVVVLPIIASYAGAKAYVHYQTRAAVERIIAQAAIVGDLEYHGISSDLSSGTVRVEGLVLNTRAIPDTINIRAVSLRTGSFMGLLNLARQSGSNTPPESLAVRFDDVSVKADGPLLQLADRLMQASAAANGVSQSNPHCANQPLNGLAIVSRLGYDTLTFDGEVAYRIEKSSGGGLTVDTEFEIKDMARVKTHMAFAGGGDVPDLTSAPAFKAFDLSYKDLSYKDRVKTFCTQAAKISGAEYVQAEIDSGMFAQQFGIVPGPGLRAAYRDFLETPNAEAVARLQPSESFDPRGISFYRPDDVLRQLNATLTVNGKLIEDLSFEFSAPVVARATSPAQAADPQAEPKRVAIRPHASSGGTPSTQEYRSVETAELERYIDYYVRLHEAGQQPREGRLTQISGGVALIERRYGTGLVTIKVPLTKIARAEVLL